MSLERFHAIHQDLKTAFSAEKIDLCRALAREYLDLAEHYKSDWNYGNAIHHAHLILGLADLRDQEDDLIDSAEIHLLAAGETPGSPQLKSFGPNMLLASELLELHRQETVLKYLDLVNRFWLKIFSFSKLRQWREDIIMRRHPDFGPHLIYHLR